MINDPLQIVLFLFTIPKCLNKVLSMLGAYNMLSIVFMSIQREIYSIYRHQYLLEYYRGRLGAMVHDILLSR